MAGLFVLSSIPGYTHTADWGGLAWLVAQTPPLLQKTMHVLLYAGLAWLLFWTLEPARFAPRFRALTAFVVAVAFGAFNEWHQLALPGRFGTVWDVVLNAGGAAVGVIVAVLL